MNIWLVEGKFMKKTLVEAGEYVNSSKEMLEVPLTLGLCALGKHCCSISERWTQKTLDQ